MITAIDPKTALIVIDMQKGIVSGQLAHPIEPVASNNSVLATAFRAHGLPVVLVHVTGGAPGRIEVSMGGERPSDWADFIPALNQQPSDIVVTKQTWGAFSNTDLHARLQDLGITQVVITGVATSIGVESTARSAFEHGYNVTLATDAMTDFSLEAHNNSVARIFPRLGETGTSADILARLNTK